MSEICAAVLWLLVTGAEGPNRKIIGTMDTYNQCVEQQKVCNDKTLAICYCVRSK